MGAQVIGRPRFGRFALGVVALVLLVFAIVAGPARAADDFGSPEAGRRIYDRTGTLSAAEVRSLESQAAAVAQAGAPVIVYLRAQDADYDDTERAARDLMEAWDVQSAPDAHDGVVIFLNLKPGDTKHGQVALFAGERHYKNGNLPERELRRIFDNEMAPLLKDGQLATGIGAGLGAIAHSLTVGPAPVPPPSALQRTASTVARLPLNLLAVLGAIGAFLLASRVWQTRPASPAKGAPTATRPSDLAPALAGGLVDGRLNAAQLAEATLLDLARRGALSVEPEGRKSMQVRPLNATVATSPSERALWAILAGAADGDGLVSAKALGRLQSKWGPFQQALRGELVERGWFDPAADARRRPLYLGGTLALLAAAVAAIVAGIGQEVWGVPGAIVLVMAGIILLTLGYSYPATTAQGEQIAAAWRAYQAGLKQLGRELDRPADLDAVLPDAVALGVISSLDKRLKEASKAGYAPAWFVRQASGDRNVAFYPIWIAFHGSATPSSSSGGGGGASAGGGGAGGGF